MVYIERLPEVSSDPPFNLVWRQGGRYPPEGVWQRKATKKTVRATPTAFASIINNPITEPTPCTAAVFLPANLPLVTNISAACSACEADSAALCLTNQRHAAASTVTGQAAWLAECACLTVQPLPLASNQGHGAQRADARWPLVAVTSLPAGDCRSLFQRHVLIRKRGERVDWEKGGGGGEGGKLGELEKKNSP